MNKKETIEKIRQYEIDLEFCKEAGYEEVAAELESKMEIYDKCYSAVLKILKHDPHNWCEYETRCKVAVRKISNGSVSPREVITDVLQLFGIDY